MDKEEIKEKIKSGMEKFAESSKKAFGKAGDAVQKFSDKSVLRIEIKQFESKRKAEIKKLGQLALDKFLADSSATLSASEEAVSAILAQVQEFDKEIASRKENLTDKEKADLEKEQAQED